VDSDNRFGFRGNVCGNLARINIESFWVNVGKNRYAAVVENGMVGRNKR